MEEIIAMAKRRGFYYPSSEIYGGLANTWDFGPYGTLLKNNLRDLWWKRFVLDRTDMVGIDASIFLNPKVWEASGHVSGFSDALVDCKSCKFRTRADHLIEDDLPDQKVEGLPVEELTKIIRENKLKCPHCSSTELTDVRKFNLLFPTHIGIVEESRSLVYLRGEIAQGIFINFKNVLNSMRVRIPFGIAQQGKAFRNEITLGQSVFRTLEFDLMEFEYFVQPNNWKKVYDYWQNEMWSFANDIGLKQENIRWREHEEFERSHYSSRTMDIEYHFSYGWKEMWGLAYRSDFDLKNHAKYSGKDMTYTDPKTNEKYIPHVIEPTFGLSRLTGIVLYDAFCKEQVNGKERIVLKLHPSIAPVKVAVIALQKDEKLSEFAKNVYGEIKQNYHAEYDDSGNIGKMYRRQDEIGTPYCVTIDYQSLEDQTITIRERDSMSQQRVSTNLLKEYLGTHLKI